MVGYYMDINSQVRLSLADADENQGTTPDMVVDVLSNTCGHAQALHDAYPKNPSGKMQFDGVDNIDDYFRNLE